VQGNLAWQQTKDVIALTKMAQEFESIQVKIMAAFDATKVTPTQITLLTMEDAEHRFDAFAQKLGHSVNTLKASRVFSIRNSRQSGSMA
jgi:acetone carboxylase gamma subunit